MTTADPARSATSRSLIERRPLPLVFKESAELDEGVEQGLRHLILIAARGELRFLLGIRKVADFHQRRRHVGAHEDAKRRLLNGARAHLDAPTQCLLDEAGECQ